MLVEKESIIEWLDNLKLIMEQEEKFNDILRDISPNFGGYSNDIAINTILKMLKSLMKDKYEWLDYYIFELKWGSLYKKGMVSDEFGNDIPLKNYDDLFGIIESSREA